MERFLNLTIVAPDGIKYEGKAKSVQVPGKMGSFTVLPMHAPLISSLSEGKITYNTTDEIKEIFIVSGFIEVKQDIVSLCIEQ